MAKGKHEQSNRAGQVLFTFHVDPSALVSRPRFIDEVFQNQAGLTCFKLSDDFIQEPDCLALRYWIERLHVANALYGNMDVISMQETAVSAQKKPIAIQRWGRAINSVLSTSSKTTTPRLQQLVQSVLPTKQAQLVIDMFRTERDNVLYPLESHFAFYLNNHQEIANINSLLDDPVVSDNTINSRRDALREMAETIESEFGDITQLEIKQVHTRNKNGVLQVISVTSCDTWFLEFQRVRGELKRLEQDQEELARDDAVLQEGLLRLNANRDHLLQMDQGTRNQIDQLNISLNALNTVINNYHPKPVIDFFIFIFGLTLLGFKTYQQEQDQRIAELVGITTERNEVERSNQNNQIDLATNDQAILEAKQKLVGITQLIANNNDRCNELSAEIARLTCLDQEENDLTLADVESQSVASDESYDFPPPFSEFDSDEALSEIGSVSSDSDHIIPTHLEPEPQTEENSSVNTRPVHPFAKAMLRAQFKKTTPPVVDEPSSNKPSALLKKTGLSLKMTEQIAAKSRTLNTSYMLLSVQAISENSTKEQIIQDFNECFTEQLNGLFATIVDNEVRLPITNQIDIERFSKWCESQVSRFNRQQVAVVPVVEAQAKPTSVLSGITSRRSQIDDDSDGNDNSYDSDDDSKVSDDMSTNHVDSESVFARPIFDAFNNRQPHLQKSLKANAEKKAASGNERVTQVTRPSLPNTLTHLTIFIPKDKIAISYPAIQNKLNEHNFRYVETEINTGDALGMTVTLSDVMLQSSSVLIDESSSVLIDELSQLELPKTVLVKPFTPFGKRYKDRVDALETAAALKKAQESTVVVAAREPEPMRFLKITTGLEGACAEIENLFTTQNIEFQQYNGSYYLNKEQADVLSTLTDTLVNIVKESRLREFGLSYLNHQFYQSRSDILITNRNKTSSNTVGLSAMLLSAVPTTGPSQATKSDKENDRELLNGLLGSNIVDFENSITIAIKEMRHPPRIGGGAAPAPEAPKQLRTNPNFFVAAPPTVLPTVLPSIQALFDAKDAPLPSEPIKLGLLMRWDILFQEFVSCISSEMVQEIREIADVETAVYPEGMQTILFVDDALMKKIHQWLLNHPEFQPDESSQVRSNP